MSLKRLLIPPVRTAFVPADKPGLAPPPDTLTQPRVAEVPPAPAAAGPWGTQAEWNAAHGARMRGVEWVVGAALMAYFAAGLAGALGIV